MVGGSRQSVSTSPKIKGHCLVEDGGGLEDQVRGLGYLFVHKEVCSGTYFYVGACKCVCVCVLCVHMFKEQEVIQSCSELG